MRGRLELRDVGLSTRFPPRASYRHQAHVWFTKLARTLNAPIHLRQV